MKYTLPQIIDIDELKQLCESFTSINGTVTAILDLQGNVLVSTGWQPICTQFHRINPETRKRCNESDTILAGRLKQGEKYSVYKCKNGLIDVAVPIMIENEHVGNFFTGQLFTEKPDIEYFRQQAKQFGFDEKKYLAALENIPVLSKDQIKINAEFLVKLTETIGKAGLKSLKSIEQVGQLETAKEVAEESEKRLKQAQQIAQLGNWKLDIINDTLHWSDEIYRIFDCQPQEFKATYEGFLEFIHPDDREMVNEAYTHSLQTQKPYDITHRLLMKNGKIKYVQETCKTTFDENGKPLISEGIVLDITKLKEQENKLHQYSKKLEEANATKERFISILGHDLRNPFNTLLGFSNLLIKNIDKYDKEKIKKQAEAINKTANQTFNLLNNLLEWSRSQQDKIPFNPKTTNVYFLVYETYLLLNNSSEAKQISIDLDVPEEINAKVDSEMIKTIIRNLLSNAIKFTPEHGKISISASKKQEFIQIEISDNGTGMNPETLNSLLKVDKTVSRPGTKGERGTGFGLLLCKEFTEKHGGKIWAESEIGKGSNFKFSLPVGGVIQRNVHEIL